ncbi:MAG: GMC family oxidoreductase [Symploca sp. SIO1A3]|nr:GMC family oxidoreductase [Symploca sp. SIO1A3]
MTEVNSIYDYIVIGAGSAGSIVASKLAASDSNAKILLLEAGRLQLNPKMYNPSDWVEVLQEHPEIEWGYESVPQENLNNRVIMLAQAKALGGCALHNATVYVRGGRSDFDAWGRVAPGWSWHDVLPHFESVEQIMKVLVAQTDHLHFINDLFAAAQQYGLPENSNYNTSESQYGYAPFQFSNIQANSKLFRETPFNTFLPAVHTNVTVQTEALVTKIRFNDTQAIGVEYVQNQETYFAGVGNEVILSAGAIASPKILMLSGIGDETELGKFDIPVVVNAPEVGKNLHDDLFISAGFSIPQAQDVPVYPYSLAPAVIFASTENSSSVVDIESSVGVGTIKGFPGPKHSFWLWPNVMHLKSKGTVTLRSSSPEEAPLIDPEYLTVPEDLQSCITALQLAIDIGNQSSLSQWREKQIAPEPGADLESYIRQTADTTYHYCGTCRMGIDESSVVDTELKVRGTSGLRVIDASVFPLPITANTAAATMMIADKGADIIIKSSDRA